MPLIFPLRYRGTRSLILDTYFMLCTGCTKIRQALTSGTCPVAGQTNKGSSFNFFISRHGTVLVAVVVVKRVAFIAKNANI